MGWGISRDLTRENHISHLIVGLLITILLPDVFHWGAFATSPHRGECLGIKSVCWLSFYDSARLLIDVFDFISVLIPDRVSAPSNVIRLVRQVDDDYGPGNGSSKEYEESEAYQDTEGEEYEEDYDENDDMSEGEDDADVEDEIENEVMGKLHFTRMIEKLL